MATTTWPQHGWAAWLNEPIVPYDDREITRINLIERVTVTKPTQYLEQSQESRQSANRERRRRRSSSEGINKDRALSYERYETGRIKALPRSSFEVEQRDSRRRRSSSEERIKDPALSLERHITTDRLSGTQYSSEVEHKDRRRRRSSSEERIRDRALSHERHITTGMLSGTQSSSEVEQKDRRRRRSSSEERIKERHITTGRLYGTQSSSEEKYRERRRRRSSSEESKDGNLSYERHITGRLANRQSSSEHVNEIGRSRSLSRERRQHCLSELQEMSLKKDTHHVGTCMHGQLLLQDGSPAPESTKIGTSKEHKPLDENRNDVDGVSACNTVTPTEKANNGDIHGDIHEEEKKPLDPSNEDSIDYKPSRACLTPTSLIYAISVTLACFWCFPIGIYAIYRALQIRPRMEAGDFEGSIRASKSAGFWATIVLVWGTILVGAVFILVVLFS